jgi:DNA repair exonuclease SbcCD ATPase subunit
MPKNGMSDLEMLPERVHAIEHKLDGLAASVDKRFDTIDARFETLELSIDKRFDEVTHAIVEQRQYTEFAFTRLDAKMTSGFAKVETRLEHVEQKLDRLEHVDQKLDRLERVEQKLDRLDHVERKVDRLDHIERKLDQLVVARTRRRRPRRK